jgi:uncharacterized membrane protein YedE/YeeE
MMPRKLTWWQGGILMSLVVLFTFSIFGANRPLGCSTSIPYISSEVFNLKEYEYSNKVVNSGAWQVVLLTGALIGGFFTSIFLTKSFSFKFIPSLWRERKNSSITSRFLWSFIGGFLLVFGARLAGGCTSGHLLSGVPQTAVSAFIFAVVTIGAVLVTGHFFYRRDDD